LFALIGRPILDLCFMQTIYARTICPALRFVKKIFKGR
jgi:hypothetical protein